MEYLLVFLVGLSLIMGGFTAFQRGGRAPMKHMKKVLVLLVGLWLIVGGFAAFQRGDFDNGNCSTATDTALLVVVGPLNYTAPEYLDGTCNQPT